ncbi:MAG: element excision factor XisH family protein [Chloroflexota bacterium]
MPARDKIHQHIMDALDNDDWTILDDPLILQHEKTIAYVDLEAERVLTAEKGSEKKSKAFLALPCLQTLKMHWGNIFCIEPFYVFWRCHINYI